MKTCKYICTITVFQQTLKILLCRVNKIFEKATKRQHIYIMKIRRYY